MYMFHRSTKVVNLANVPVQTYDEVVKDMILDEKQYLRDLQMITKVFREILQKDSIGSIREIDHIFSNVTDVMELTVTLITSLEDTLEMTEEGNMPAIGAWEVYISPVSHLNLRFSVAICRNPLITQTKAPFHLDLHFNLQF